MAETVVGALPEVIDEYLLETFAFNPVTAANLGLHDYDGRAPDYSAAAITRRVSTLRALERKVQALAVPSEKLAAYEHALLLRSLRAEAFRWDDYAEHTRSPELYTSAGTVTLYVKRDYAPVADRVCALTQHLRAIPDVLTAATQNLRPDLAQPLLDSAIRQARGQVTYLETELPDFISQAGDAAIQRQALQARDEAVAAWNGYIRDLGARPADGGGDFSIGRRLFEGLLGTGELVDLPVEALRRVAEADLERNREAVREAAGHLKRDAKEAFATMGDRHPTADRLIPETAGLLEEIRAFIVERDLITIPSEVRCRVRPSPPFRRAYFAMMDTVGAFETKATESYYYVTPVDPAWPAADQEAWLRRFNYPTLLDVSVHEAYPGHYVHLLHVRQSRSRLGKVTRATACTEGWAHYCEQMMVEEGFHAGDPMLRLAQLGEALLRDCRFLIALGMHTGAMTVEEGTALIVSNAFYEEHPARQEAIRGTFDPMFLNYTLGKLMWLKLREDYRREQGSAFRLKAFHDAALGYGLAPLPLIRALVLREPSGAIL
jgi:uncharacterized protein (DUF885 family)